VRSELRAFVDDGASRLVERRARDGKRTRRSKFRLRPTRLADRRAAPCRAPARDEACHAGVCRHD
jgi:hypothetical protein